MPAVTGSTSPDLASYLKSLKSFPADTSVDHLISLLKRGQIKNSRPCAIATTHLYVRIVAEFRFQNVRELLERVRNVGRRLCEAQPREFAVGNITRRVLGLIREVTDPKKDVNGAASLSAGASVPASTAAATQNGTSQSTDASEPLSMRQVKEDVLNGLRDEMLDELDQADEQISGYALEQIYPTETILTYTSSLTTQKFLLSAAKKRKFNVIHVEGYPNEVDSTYDTVLNGGRHADTKESTNNERFKSLIASGITVTVIPDSAVFAVMPQVSKVLLSAHAVLSNGAVVVAAGSRVIASAAKAHRAPVIILSPIYKLSPLYPYDPQELIGVGDPGNAVDFRDGGFVEDVDVINPTHDYIGPELIDLFVTNLGAYSPSYIYRLIEDHYRNEDVP